MVIFFTLLFLAALVGIFKPYIANSRRWHFMIGALLAFIAVGITAPKQQDADRANKQATPLQPAADPSAPDANKLAVSAEPTSKWDYSETKDDMRGTVTKFATLVSENEVDLEFPYGEVHGTITIRRRPNDGLNIMFSVDKGQILCHSFSGGHLSVRFDNKPIQQIACSESSDGSSETAFFSSEGRLLRELKSSKKVIIEAEFFQKGRQQFTFDSAGLKWD